MVAVDRRGLKVSKYRSDRTSTIEPDRSAVRGYQARYYLSLGHSAVRVAAIMGICRAQLYRDLASATRQLTLDLADVG